VGLAGAFAVVVVAIALVSILHGGFHGRLRRSGLILSIGVGLPFAIYSVLYVSHGLREYRLLRAVDRGDRESVRAIVRNLLGYDVEVVPVVVEVEVAVPRSRPA
jgi:hypothetical protein